MDSMLNSSMEELSTEERLMLQSSKRQEPQGEEHNTNEDLLNAKEHNSVSKSSHSTLSSALHHLHSSPLTRTKQTLSSGSSSSGSSSSSSICGECDQDAVGCSGLYNGSSGITSASSNSNGNSNSNSMSRASHRNSSERNTKNMSLDSNSHSTYNTLIIHRNNSSLLADTWIPASHEFTSIGMGNNRNSTCSNSRKSLSPSREQSAGSTGYVSAGQVMHQKPSCESHMMDGGVTSNELSEIPRDYLDQLTVLKHLAKEVQQDPIGGSPNQNLLRSASFSRSQPDLSQNSITSHLPVNSSHGCEASKHLHQTKKKKHSHANCNSNSGDKTSSQYSGEEVLPSVQILEILMRENSNLKAELVNAHRRINAIHKLETELTRLSREHTALFEKSERRESLERTARAKLSTEVKRLTAVNRELLCSSNSLQNLSPYATCSDLEVYKKELAKKDLTIAQIVSQNKELVATKERQEIELAAQRATLVEQRAHIDILDSALTNSQAHVLRLEEESRKKQEYVDKVSQLQRALSSLQLANDKREQSEKKLRSQLDSEISDLKLQLASANANSNHGRHPDNRNQNQSANNSPVTKTFTAPPPYPGNGNSAQNSNKNQNSQQPNLDAELQTLQEKIKMSEDKIVNLSTQVVRWENFFSAEGEKTAPSPAITTSTPNTPNSWSSRGGTPHFFGGSGGGNGNESGSSSTAGQQDDLSTTQTKATDLEWKIKDLESRLVERDAMIRVLHLQNVPSTSPTSPLFSSYNSSSSSNMNTTAPGYRESPSYSSGVARMLPVSTTHPPIINHQVSVSLASIIDKGNNNGHHIHTTQGSGMIERMDPVLMYSKLGKCDSEPPSYANIPLKMRYGGSGSSLAKNSNESLGSGGFGLSGGATPNSGPGSVSSSTGSKTKSIDEQLKELDHQLLSKGNPGSGLKMQSGLCCIPGFSHPSSAARKGKIPQSLLESLNSTTTANNTNSNPPVKKQSVLPPLPKPPSFANQSTTPNQSQTTIRTSSGPPFISPSASSSSVTPPVGTTTLSLSNSVDSILTDAQNAKNASGGTNVFSPVSSLPKGLPPKSPGIPEAGKCRSLERDQRNKPANEPGAGKYTPVLYDASRCKSLDRRDMRAQSKLEEKVAKEKEEKEKKVLKSGVSSKAAFFGGLLTRRSPSPSRQKDKDKEKEKEKAEFDSVIHKVPIVQPKVVRFPFIRAPQQQIQSTENCNSNNDQDIDTAFLDMQGRSSQRNRISKWTMSHSNLEAVQEQSGSGSDSPWVHRRSGEMLDSDGVGRMGAVQSPKQVTFETKNNDITTSGNDDSKKWGRVVKTPFGLRYTFGSPRIAENPSATVRKKSSAGNF